MENNTTPIIPKKKRIAIWCLLISIGVIFFSIVSYASYLYIKASATVDASQQELERGEKSERRSYVVQPLEDNISVLLMGVDDSDIRNGKYGVRTDALILATFNKQENSIKLLSIPRDTYTYIDVEKKYDKINHAHAIGGVDATITTVENLLDIPVDYFVKLDFEAFIEVVDILGGIEMDVPVSFKEQNSKDEPNAITIKSGYQTLDGEQALALARTRKIDSDIQRGQRQQLVMEAIINKTMSMSSIAKYSNAIDALSNNLSTNLSFNEMMSFMNYVANSNSLEVESLQLKGDFQTINNIDYYDLDEQNLVENQTTLKEHLQLTDDEETAASSDDDSGTGDSKE